MRILEQKIKVAAVSYLNTKPLLYGIERSELMDEMELILDYPSRLAARLQEGSIDLALLPVAAIPGIPGASIISDYGIAADGDVASVALFSRVPLDEVQAVYLDYQSRTSVRLAQLLFTDHWRKEVTYLPAGENYMEAIQGNTAGVIIGDRALLQLPHFEYVYDLSAAWKAFTGLDFDFAAWVANKELPATFVTRFNEANALGLQRLEQVIAANPFPGYSLHTYYTRNIKFYLDEQKLAGMKKFLELIA